MRIILCKGFIGFCLAIVFDILGLIFLKNQMPVEMLDAVLIAAPIIFSFCTVLTEVTEYAEEHKTKCQDFKEIWSHILVIVVILIMQVILIQTSILQSMFGVLVNAATVLGLIESLYKPSVLAKWNSSITIVMIPFLVAALSVYLALIMKSVILLMLLVGACIVLFVQNY